jgi:hypothetical protein
MSSMQCYSHITSWWSAQEKREDKKKADEESYKEISYQQHTKS